MPPRKGVGHAERLRQYPDVPSARAGITLAVRPGRRMGAARRCHSGKGVAISERIVGLKEGDSIDVDVCKREGMPGVVKSMTARFELSDAPGGTHAYSDHVSVASTQVLHNLLGSLR